MDWVTIGLAAIPGILAVGGLWVRVNRLERDAESFVRKDIFEAHLKNIEDKLDILRDMIRPIQAAILESTSPGIRRQ